MSQIEQRGMENLNGSMNGSAPRTDGAEQWHNDISDAVDDASQMRSRAASVLNRSQVQAQQLLESAQSKAAATVAEGDEQAAAIIESARERAIAIVAAAQDRADDLIKNYATSSSGC